jgi:hypothetical protein
MTWHVFTFDVELPPAHLPLREQIARKNWWIDLLLLDTTVRKIVDNYKNTREDDGAPWRWCIHRRSLTEMEVQVGKQQGVLPANATAGHHFQLQCAADKHLAAEIARALEEDETVKSLGSLVRLLPPEASEDAQTGEEWWAPELRKVGLWRVYVNGLSETLLALVRQIQECKGWPTPNLNPASQQELEDHYRRADRRLRDIWRMTGAGCLIHHLNEHMGYEPVELSGMGVQLNF